MQRRPKKTNPKAKPARSRYEKVECPYCGGEYSKPSLAGHVSLCDAVPKKEKNG